MPEPIQDPINAFPEYVQKIISHYSEAKGYPHEYFIQAVLGAVSTALGRSATLNTGNYTAIGSLWCIILGKRGYTKSEPLDDAFKPIRKYQFDIIDRHNDDMEAFNQFKAEHPKDKSLPPPEPQKTIVSDTTPEKLVVMLANNPKGIGMVYDEIAGFVGRFNRYNSGADEQMFLTLFNGSSVFRDRLNGQSAYAKFTYLTIIGTTQPAVLKSVFGDKSESGFFDRWLITEPDGFKKQYPNRNGIDPNIEAKYNQIINILLAIPFNIDYEQLRYSNTSYKIVNDFQIWMVDQQNETDIDDYRGVLAKMEIYLHKFALLLQAVEYACGSVEMDIISDSAAGGAVVLTKYFIDQAQKVRIQNPIEQLKNEWPEIYQQLPSPGISFSRNEFVKKCAQFGLGESIADKFLKANSEKSERLLFYKVKQGFYTKNMF